DRAGHPPAGPWRCAPRRAARAAARRPRRAEPPRGPAGRPRPRHLSPAVRPSASPPDPPPDAPASTQPRATDRSPETTGEIMKIRTALSVTAASLAAALMLSSCAAGENAQVGSDPAPGATTGGEWSRDTLNIDFATYNPLSLIIK